MKWLSNDEIKEKLTRLDSSEIAEAIRNLRDQMDERAHGEQAARERAIEAKLLAECLHLPITHS